MFSFKFKGKSSRDFGITVLRRPPRMSANSRIEVIEVDGYHGSFNNYLGENSFTISMEISVEGKENIDRIKEWLRGKGEFERSDVKGRYMLVEQQSSIEFRMVSKGLYISNITLQSIDPFWYKKDDQWERIGGEVYIDDKYPSLIPSTIYIPKHTAVPYERLERVLTVTRERGNKEIAGEENEPTIVTTYTMGEMTTIMYVKPYKKGTIEGDVLTLKSESLEGTHTWEGFKVVNVYSNGLVEARATGLLDEKRIPLLEPSGEGITPDNNPFYDVIQGIVVDDSTIKGKNLKMEFELGDSNKNSKVFYYDGPEMMHEEVINKGSTSLVKEFSPSFNTFFMGMITEDAFPGSNKSPRGDSSVFPSTGHKSEWILKHLKIHDWEQNNNLKKVENIGNANSAPEIRLIGNLKEEVDLVVNGTRFIYKPFHTKYDVIIDCREKSFTGYDGYKSGELIIGYNYPELSPGENEVKVNKGKDVTMLIRRKDRWRG